MGLVKKEHGNEKVLLSFECETLKADKDAEDHIAKYMPNPCDWMQLVSTKTLHKLREMFNMNTSNLA